MKSLGRIPCATVVIALLAGPALAQGGPARYGEADKPKTPAQIAAERRLRRLTAGRSAISRNRRVDPWGMVRSDNAPPKDGRQGAPAEPKAKASRAEAGCKVIKAKDTSRRDAGIMCP